MKKLFKISLGILIAGLILTVIGFWGHGAQNIHFNGWRPQVTRKVNEKLLADRQFDRLDVSTISANITIKTGPTFRIAYHGANYTLPKALIADRLASVKQTGTVAGVFWDSNEDDEVTITVPKGTKLSGKISTVDGNVTVDGVDLTGVTVNTRDGDIDLHNLAVNGGKAQLESGDFTSHNVTFRGSYFVKNSDGDNEVINPHVDGYFLKTATGDNEVDGAEHEGGQQEANSSAANSIHLTTQDGDNTIQGVQAVQ